MEKSRIDYSKYRLEKSIKNLRSSKILFNNNDFEGSLNRSYYAIFHALRAVTILDGFESSKHSGVISFFNHNYVKNGIFEKITSEIIRAAFRFRENADYQDFYVVSKEQAQSQIKNAEKILAIIKPYLISRWEIQN